jgi:hypothetical protein
VYIGRFQQLSQERQPLRWPPLLGQVRAQVAAPKPEEQDQAKELRVMLRLVGSCSRFRSVSPPAVSNAPGHLANR